MCLSVTSPDGMYNGSNVIFVIFSRNKTEIEKQNH